MPRPDNLTLSVSVVDRMSTDEIHAHGRVHASRNGNPPKAFALVFASAIERNELRIERDDHPPLHANVIGWPKEKSARKSIALQLAADSQLHMVSDA